MIPTRVHATVVLVAALCLSVGVPAVVAGQSNVTLTVTVVDQDGDTVSDVDISATWDDGGPVNETTRSNGQALVDVPEGANVTISVHDEDYVRNTPLVIQDAETGEVDVEVAEAGSATVEVVDAQGPVGDAKVEIYDGDDRIADGRTASDGTFATRDIEQGDYEVRVLKEGYLRNATDLTVDGDVTHEVEVQQDSRLLQVTVRDDHYSPPQAVANASVRVGGRGTVTTLSNGEATVQVPVNANYDITVTRDGYETNETSVRVREEAESANLTIQRTDAISLDAANERVVAGESVRVTVTDEYGDPVSGADVAIDGESAGTTNDEGELSVTVEGAGTHNLTATSGDLEATASVEGVGADGDEATATASATENETGTETSDFSGPGFTVVGAVVALLAAGLLARRD
ncbi:PGF-CTERM protein [Halomicrobium zhouii]|uniref:PGF-CTERM protein n=1 Tax=Halomicrobium zhouii TaxID=767519 RepID=A0A1I6L310_9EURY|nr:carboxypeptidase regulatory-like domain-containing protein [Halomicrobium zhouii]SFR97893.1 PGF-CTERM protein [Halomicrobium zhouii]